MEEVIFGAKPGEPVPEADPNDIKTLWGMIREMEESSPPGSRSAIAGWEPSLKPGTNPEAVRYRTSWLSMLTSFSPLKQIVSPWVRKGQPRDALIQAIATTPMTGVPVGVTHHGLPFSLAGFMARVVMNSFENALRGH